MSAPSADPVQAAFHAGCDALADALRAGTPSPLNDLLAPEGPIAAAPDLAAELAFTEYVMREDLGQRPTPGEYLERFPDLADHLGRLFGIDRLLQESAGAPAAGSTEPGGASDVLPRAGRPGRFVGDYEIVAPIGAGGMGTVYRARHPALGRDAAIKFLRAGDRATPGEVARLGREAAAVARLDHPNIVRIYDIGEDGGRPYLVLEYVAGGTLREALSAGPLSARSAAAAVGALARAAAHAHERGVIHRDIKPGNVMLGPTGADGERVPRLTDFGLAALDRPDARTLTAGGFAVGTAAYMAPEQARADAGWVTPAVDVYALGVVLYECLTGRPPFLADTPLETVRRAAADEPVPPRRLVPGVPRDLETVCLKCLAKLPLRRYESASDLADDLERFRENRPIRARRTTWAEHLGRGTRRRPALALALAVAGLALGGLLSNWASFTADLRRQRDAVAEQRAIAQAERDRARDLLYSGQVNQAALLAASDPPRAASLLADAGACPAERREFAWGYVAGLVAPASPLKGHPAGVGVNRLAASADGRVVVTGDTAGGVRLWRGNSVTPERAWDIGSPVAGLAVSADGRRAATGGLDGRVRLWDLATGVELRSLRVRGGAVAVALSADGSRVAAGGTLSPTRGDGTAVSVWRATGGDPVTLARDGRGASALAFAPDGKTLFAAYAGADGGEWVAWDVPAGTVRLARPIPEGVARALAVSPDGTRVAAAPAGPSEYAAGLWRLRPTLPLRVWSFEGEPLWEVPVTDSLTALAFGPDGGTLAGAARSGPVLLWDARTGAKLTRLEAVTTGKALRAPPGGLSASGRLLLPGFAPRAATGVALSPGGRLVSASADGSLRRHDLSPTRGERRPPRWLGRVHTFEPTVGGALLETDAGVWLWNPHTGVAEPCRNARPLPPSLSRRANAAGRVARLDFAGNAAIVTVTRPGLPDVRFDASPTLRLSIALSPDGRTIATGGWGPEVRLHHADTGRELLTLDAAGEYATQLAFGPDGRTLYARVHGRDTARDRVACWVAE